MTPDTWRRIKSILDKALELGPSDRPAFLDEACGSDGEIRKEVLSLLRSASLTASMDPAPASPDRGPLPGGSVASYRILNEIGRGGMGVVYRVVHTGLEREFALKTLKGSNAAQFGVERFQREAKLLGSLKHPHIVDVTDFGIAESLPYLVMELVSGPTLRERTADPLPAEEALDILEALAEAVDYAHSRGVLHGDLKPDNVILTGGGCKVLDFGLSGLVAPNAEMQAANGLRESSPSRTETVTELPTMGGMAGTPAYMAPELFTGAKPTFASDLYALAVVAFEILVGRRPFVVRIEDIATGWNRPPTPLPSGLNGSLPSEVDAPLLAALSEDPSERPRSARAFSTELRSAMRRGQLRVRRRRALPGRLLASVALASIVGLASSSLWSWRWCRGLENRLLDARWALLPRGMASPEILVATVDDRWLEAHPESLSQQGDLFGARLSSLFASGARAIALDIVLPTEWSHAEEFSRLVLSHADHLTLAAFGSFSDGTIRGRECLNPLAASLLGPERYERLFGLVNLEPDGDGAVRRGRWGFTGREGRIHLAWASRAALNLRNGLVPRDSFLLDQSVPIGAVPTVSFLELPEALAHTPDLLRDKLVIVGATYEGSADTFRATDENGVDRPYPGAFVQARLVHSLLSSVPVQEAGSTVVLASCCLVLAGLTLIFLLPGTHGAWLLAAPAVLVVLGAISFAAFAWFHLSIPTAGPMTSLGVGFTGAIVLKRVLP
jgi:serine/threonine protein kinase